MLGENSDQLPVGPAQWGAAYSASGTLSARLPAGAESHMGAAVDCLGRAARMSVCHRVWRASYTQHILTGDPLTGQQMVSVMSYE